MMLATVLICVLMQVPEDPGKLREMAFRSLRPGEQSDVMLVRAKKTYYKNIEKIPWKPFKLIPMNGVYVVEMSGMMDGKTYHHTLEGVEFKEAFRAGRPYRLDEPSGNPGVRVVLEEGGPIMGGFGSMVGMESGDTHWYGAIRVTCPVNVKELELLNANRVRVTLPVPTEPGEVTGFWRAFPDLRIQGGQLYTQDPYWGVDVRATGLDFFSYYSCSKDLEYIMGGAGKRSLVPVMDGMRRISLSYKHSPTCGGERNSDACTDSSHWERYLFLVGFKGLKPYGNVYEVGKGWLDSVELIEKHFKRE